MSGIGQQGKVELLVAFEFIEGEGRIHGDGQYLSVEFFIIGDAVAHAAQLLCAYARESHREEEQHDIFAAIVFKGNGLLVGGVQSERGSGIACFYSHGISVSMVKG